MNFYLVKSGEPFGPTILPCGLLHENNWDDWFEFETTYILDIITKEGDYIELGAVKIGQLNMGKEQRKPKLEDQFQALGPEFFSLGQDEDYYKKLHNLNEELRNTILNSLSDIVFDENLYELVKNERVTTLSLKRSVSDSTIKGHFQRILQGQISLTEYNIKYYLPTRTDDKVIAKFDVKPKSQPPSNIHVLIGRNGVGKTTMLSLMTEALTREEPDLKNTGTFGHDFIPSDNFANVVSVSFSAFDKFKPVEEKQENVKGIKCFYIGLKTLSNSKEEEENTFTIKTPKQLTNEFAKSLAQCARSSKIFRLEELCRLLESDPIFEEADLPGLFSKFYKKNTEKTRPIDRVKRIIEQNAFRKAAFKVFDRLSSGHKIVLLTITKFVEHVEEKSLVFIDEPEAHLHPPLLSAFVRALSHLMTDRNGVAIIATHSPVVLQEVPSSCVQIIRRVGSQVRIERPDLQTFGENVGILTHSIFGLEVTKSGFIKLLAAEVKKGKSYTKIVEDFQHELGGEARAILRTLIKSNDSEA